MLAVMFEESLPKHLYIIMPQIYIFALDHCRQRPSFAYENLGGQGFVYGYDCMPNHTKEQILWPKPPQICGNV